MGDLYSKIGNATKWSALTEILSKLVTPITSIILARLLTPQAFGAVATIAMIISFAEIFTDAGFQKYIIQHNFKDQEDKYNSVNVAFWSNLLLSLVLWLFIVLYRQQIADLVGSPNLGNGIAVACASIPLAAFSSIQTGLYKRDFDFKTLFSIRVVCIFIPILVTIPLAFYLKNYWALISGTLFVNLSNAILLTLKSKWKPRFYFSYRRLREMFSFCIWFVIEAVAVWMTSYIDVFFIGTKLGEYYLGLYKTSITTVGQITSLITSIILPVMLPALSRLQNNIPKMRRMLLVFQKQTGILLIPLGVGIFIYRDLITYVLLGTQWMEASMFIGLWGLVEALTIIFSRFCSIIYPSVGKPKVSVLSQFLYIILFVPSIYISANYGFEPLYWTRVLVRIYGIVIDLIFAYILIRQSTWKMLKNVFPEFFSAFVMAIISYLLLIISDNMLWKFISIIVSGIVYFIVLSSFKEDSRIIKSFLIPILRKSPAGRFF